jgi:hypothetical protein
MGSGDRATQYGLLHKWIHISQSSFLALHIASKSFWVAATHAGWEILLLVGRTGQNKVRMAEALVAHPGRGQRPNHVVLVHSVVVAVHAQGNT